MSEGNKDEAKKMIRKQKGGAKFQRIVNRRYMYIYFFQIESMIVCVCIVCVLCVYCDTSCFEIEL